MMLIEVFRYPDVAERRANTGQLGSQAPQAAIRHLPHQKGTSRTSALLSPSRGSEIRTVSGSSRSAFAVIALTVRTFPDYGQYCAG
ncbi:hypothetical protein [Streptomyces sp. NPDC059003]|uniref:hypothetical protein n=1 Tax=Streptomyces sp. NPDC059003 TaxID=3346691 RepID=UPI00368A4395